MPRVLHPQTARFSLSWRIPAFTLPDSFWTIPRNYICYLHLLCCKVKSDKILHNFGKYTLILTFKLQNLCLGVKGASKYTLVFFYTFNALPIQKNILLFSSYNALNSIVYASLIFIIMLSSSDTAHNSDILNWILLNRDSNKTVKHSFFTNTFVIIYRPKRI
jgi:hypothetical protein